MELEKLQSARTGDTYYQGRHPSGLEVYLYPMKGVSTAQAVIGTRYGSIDNCFQRAGEPAPECAPLGIAHYLEHKLFEGEDGDAFARFAETGANANAYTGFESTCYVFSCTSRFCDSLRILLDFVQTPYFTEETVAKERGIIAQELRMYEDLPGWQVYSNYLRAMYHAHPVREDTAGTLESIEKITPECLYRCYDAFYRWDNMVLVVAGHFEMEQVLALCDEMLKPTRPMEVSRVLPQEPENVARPRVEQRLSVAMPVFQFGYKEPGDRTRNEEDLAAMSVLLHIMASDASHMFRRLLDEGLVNEASFSREYLEGSGYATVMFGGESRDPEAAAAVIREEAARLKKQGIPEAEFRWAKRSLYGDCISALDHAQGVANWLADLALRGLELFTYIDALAGLTLGQVEAKLDVLRDDRSVLSVIWPQGTALDQFA